MLHRLRLSLQNESIEKLSGEVEVDETYVGGSAHKMNKKQRNKRPGVYGCAGKAVVMGLASG